MTKIKSKWLDYKLYYVNLTPLSYFDLFCRWDDRMSAVIPDEDVFYTVGFLLSSGFKDWQEFDLQNKEVLLFCEDNGIKVKQYLPNYSTEREWMQHFGPKWRAFQESKAQFDPKMLLSPGQRIFNQN